MTTVFVDVDGVLNDAGTMRYRHNHDAVDGFVDVLCENNVRALDRLISDLDDPEVVISSTWRVRLDVPTMETALAEHGFAHGIDGTTPVILQGGRGKEIACYVSENDCEDSLILDDMNTINGFDDDHYRVSNATGLTLEDVETIMTQRSTHCEQPLKSTAHKAGRSHAP